jgi:aryl-alcohol dehydrogenase-like predicted oxidoreductase
MSDMTLPQNALGRTGLSVTKLGYGAMEVRGSRIWGGRPIEDAEAEKILNAVLDNGITFIDTANDYGRSEEYIGRFVSHRRDEFVLATKCGCTVVRRDESTDDTPHVWTKENLFRGLHESLARMRTDHVDVMQLPNPTVEECE